jgi:hypothetical protein
MLLSLLCFGCGEEKMCFRCEKAQKVLPSLDMKQHEWEDIEDEVNGIPPRFGYRHKVNYTLDNSGE